MVYVYKRVNILDIDSLKQLRQVFAVAFEEVGDWNVNKPSDTYLSKVLADKNYIALVAKKEDGGVVGGLTAHVLPKIDGEYSEIYLYDLAVLNEYRRQGIATQLITELKNFAKTYGAHTIFVQADNEDVGAVALYTKLSSSVESEITNFDIAVQ